MFHYLQDVGQYGLVFLLFIREHLANILQALMEVGDVKLKFVEMIIKHLRIVSVWSGAEVRRTCRSRKIFAMSTSVCKTRFSKVENELGVVPRKFDNEPCIVCHPGLTPHNSNDAGSLLAAQVCRSAGRREGPLRQGRT